MPTERYPILRNITIALVSLPATLGAGQVAEPWTSFRDCEVCPEMVVLPEGRFVMGDGSGDGAENEQPAHEVTIPGPFAIGRTEVTFEEFDACVAAGGCSHRPDDENWGRGNRPVSNVNWNDAQEYVTWLSDITNRRYRLPTEAEWEYASRAGTTSRYPWGDTLGEGNAICLRCNSGPAFGRAAGELAPNAWGLHDTIGSMREWVEDSWIPHFEGAPLDGSAWLAGDTFFRVMRGGSFYDEARYLTSSSRSGSSAEDRNPFFGFRVACDL